jgi:hypothetical protein
MEENGKERKRKERNHSFLSPPHPVEVLAPWAAGAAGVVGAAGLEVLAGVK